jgi:hypothetical protein
MKAPRLKVGAPKEWLLGLFLAAIQSAPSWGSERKNSGTRNP